MAQGDVRARTSTVAASAHWHIQPALGEHWLLKRVFSNVQTGTSPNVIPNVGIILWFEHAGASWGNPSLPANSAELYKQEMNIGFNNEAHISLRNNSTINTIVGYSAIQIK